MTTTERWPGRAVLMVAHCAGMVDLVALPVWIGALIAHYKLDPQQAGTLATLFLAGAVGSSLFFAPRFNRVRGRIAAAAGFAIAGLAFLAVPLMSSSFGAMAALHALAGLSAGCGLSFTHGTVGRSARPHRLFALLGVALGLFAILFLGATPQLVAALGGAALFKVFGGIMLTAAVACALAFPSVQDRGPEAGTVAGKLSPQVWFTVAGVSGMALVQAMIFSFVERMGADRGFGVDAVTGVFIALGFVNLLPSVLAAALEKRLPARSVLLAGPMLQAGIALLITQTATLAPYAAGAVLFTGVIIFTHTFAFGVIARLDLSGRALAATPAMLMVGSAIGPILGGTLVKLAGGYGSLGVAAAIISAGTLACFYASQRAGVRAHLEGQATS